jgi:hypothetical protein
MLRMEATTSSSRGCAARSNGPTSLTRRPVTSRPRCRAIHPRRHAQLLASAFRGNPPPTIPEMGGLHVPRRREHTPHLLTASSTANSFRIVRVLRGRSWPNSASGPPLPGSPAARSTRQHGHSPFIDSPSP